MIDATCTWHTLDMHYPRDILQESFIIFKKFLKKCLLCTNSSQLMMVMPPTLDIYSFNEVICIDISHLNTYTFLQRYHDAEWNVSETYKWLKLCVLNFRFWLCPFFSFLYLFFSLYLIICTYYLHGSQPYSTLVIW